MHNQWYINSILKASMCSKDFSNVKHLGFLVCATGLPCLRFLVVTSHTRYGLNRGAFAPLFTNEFTICSMDAATSVLVILFVPVHDAEAD